MELIIGIIQVPHMEEEEDGTVVMDKVEDVVL